MNNQQQKSIRDTVFNKIKSGEVKMRPKIYFVLKAILIILGAVAAALFILYLVSFIIFAMRASGIWFLPGFGIFGMRIFLVSLPWILILIALILILVLDIFAKRFTFVWRRPILYSAIGIVILTIMGSFIIIRTDFHHDLFLRSRERTLPVAGSFYRGFSMPLLPNVHYGIISEMTDKGFYLETQRGEILTILISPDVCCLPEEGIKVGDRVVVLGDRNDGTVQASNIREVEEPFRIFERRLLPPDKPER